MCNNCGEEYNNFSFKAIGGHFDPEQLKSILCGSSQSKSIPQIMLTNQSLKKIGITFEDFKKFFKDLE